MTLFLGACQPLVCDAFQPLLDLLEQAADEYTGLARPGDSGLLLLPEVCYGGFDYDQRDKWVTRTPDLLDKLHDLAGKRGLNLAGTFWHGLDNSALNTLYLLSPGLPGPKPVYAKRHLFPLTREEEFFTPGPDAPQVFALPGLEDISLGPSVCFELRFPEHFRMLAGQDAHVVLVPSQWPATRTEHLRTLARARALENQCFVLSVNCAGPSPFGELAGNSSLLSPWGEELFALGKEPGFAWAAYDRESLDRARAVFNTRRSPFYSTMAIS